jgi:hypothetical protein
MDLTPEVLKIIANGGISLVVLVIWYITFRTSSNQYQELVERLFKQIEQDTKYKELLTGILTRLETKIDYSDRKKNEQ